MSSGLRRFQQSGQFHFLTFSCYRRQAKLNSPDAYDLFVQCLAGCEKVVEDAKSLPQALKRLHIFDGLAARLKSGPPQNLPQSYFLRGLLEDMRCRFAMRIYGYVVMPEHVHLLVNELRGATLAGWGQLPNPHPKFRKEREI